MKNSYLSFKTNETIFVYGLLNNSRQTLIESLIEIIIDFCINHHNKGTNPFCIGKHPES